MPLSIDLPPKKWSNVILVERVTSDCSPSLIQIE